MFLNQKGKYPFPKVTPIRLPEIIRQFQTIHQFSEPTTNTEINDVCSIIKEWYSPLIGLDNFKYAYLMNNGITQALETIGLMHTDIHILQGDYSWLKTIKAGTEVAEKVSCEISYASCPSAINGEIVDTTWPSKMHILDGAYVGTSLIKTIVPTNTEMILLGFSKNLGVPELRAGIIFSRKPIQHLEVFQKVFGYVGLGVFRTLSDVCKKMPIEALAETLKDHQARYCSMHTEFIPSDSALLATTEDSAYSFYRRPNGITRIPLGESITHCIDIGLL
jgi:hypothetical protein